MTTYDIHFEGLPTGETQGFQFLTFGNYPRHMGVSGIQKLVNRVLKCMMTPLGSDLSDPTYGTNLIAAFMGNVDTELLSDMATMAVRDTENKIREYDSQRSSPTDERLSGIEIEEILVTDAPGVVLHILVKNVAGTRALTAIPLELG